MKVLSQIAAAAATLAVYTLPALAQQQELAAQLNEEGKQLIYKGQYHEASEKFRQAVARSPEAKYFYNLCASLAQEGELAEAHTACVAVGNNNPTPELATKAQNLTQRIEADAKTRGIALQPAGDPNVPPEGTPPDPNNPNPTTPANPTNPTPVGAPAAAPAQNLFVGTSSDNKYTWTLGLDLYGGAGKIGSDDAYGTASGGLRIKIDYLLNRARRIGAQGYFQYTHFGQGEMQGSTVSTLDVMDFGIAAYKDFCVKERLCLRPLAGAQLAFMSPNDSDGDGQQTFDYAALGARLELGAHFAFGGRLQHVFGVAVGTNAYTRVLSESMDGSAESVHLEKGGAAGYFALGYTYRFDTPLGSSPFVTLE
jgi:tetratricopeptide (TPR) repeat protein